MGTKGAHRDGAKLTLGRQLRMKRALGLLTALLTRRFEKQGVGTKRDFLLADRKTVKALKPMW
jgi:hypothetical protein